MPTNIDGPLGLLLDVSIKAAILASIAGILLPVLRVRNANLQHRVWSVFLVAMLVLPLLVYVAPRVPVPIVKRAAVTAVKTDEARPAPTQPVPVQYPSNAVAVADKFIDTVATPAPTLSDNVTRAAEESVLHPMGASKIRLSSFLLAAYVVGLIWFGQRLFIGIWRARQLVRLSHAADVAQNQQPAVRTTPVRESALVRVPLTIGWLPPTIMLPNDWRRWDEPLLSAVLAHEQEHVRRGDPWIALLAELNLAIYWFHPVAWFLRRRLSTLAETACDDVVIASSGDRSGYARHLLTIAGRLSEKGRRFAPAGVAMARTPKVEHRINAVLDSTRPLARRLSVATTAFIVIVTVTLALLTAGLKASDESPELVTPTTTPAATQALAPTSSPSPAPEFAPSSSPASILAPSASSTGWSPQASAEQDDSDAALLSAGPVRDVTSEAVGGFAIKFPVNVPKGRKFGISFGEWPIRAAGPVYSVWEKEAEGPVSATLEWGYLKDSKSKPRSDGVVTINLPREGSHSKDSRSKQYDNILRSSDQWMEYRLKVPSAYPFGIATLAGVPLNNLPPDERKTILVPADSPLAKAKSGIRLMLIVRKDQDPQTAADVEKIEPRGELIVSLVPIEKPKPAPTPQQQLADAWRQAESGVGTFFVRYQNITGMHDWFKPLALEDVRKIVRDAASHNLDLDYGTSATDADQSHRFVEEIFHLAMNDEFLKSMNGKPVRMAQSDFRMVGIKRMDTSGTRADEKPYIIQLCDGDIDVKYDIANKQLDVQSLRPSDGMVPIPIRDLQDFRTTYKTSSFVPINIDKTLASATTKELPSGRLLVSFNGVEIVADPRNSFVERLTLPRIKDPRVMDTNQEILQFGPKAFPGNVVFPRVRLVCQYQEGKLFMLHVVANDELRVNEGFSDGDFTLKIPAGTNIIDRRLDNFRPDSKRIDDEIPDVAAYLKAHVPKVREKIEPAALLKGEPRRSLAPIPIATPALPEK